MLCASNNLNSQVDKSNQSNRTFCYTEDKLNILPPIRLAANSDYCLRTYFHIVKNCDGTIGISNAQIEAVKNILNLDFAPHGISFQYSERINYIDNSNLCNHASPTIYEERPRDDGINIYLFSEEQHTNILNGENTNGGHGTSGSNTPYAADAALYVAGNYWNEPNQSLINSKVISHEMGHVLGLSHTFINPCQDSNVIWEASDGSNCDIGGDRICDTPADPNIRFNINYSNCQWTGVEPYASTENGYCNRPEPISAYNPDEKNTMSYSNPFCMEYFTQGQGTFMRNFIANSPHLSPMLIDCDSWCEGFPKILTEVNPKYANLVVDNNNDIIITGRNYLGVQYIHGIEFPDNFIAKFSPNGCLQWVKELNYYPGIEQVLIDSQNNIIITSDPYNTQVSKYSSEGELIWYKNVNNLDHIIDFDIDPNDNIYILGYNGTYPSNVLLIKLDSDNNGYENIDTRIFSNTSFTPKEIIVSYSSIFIMGRNSSGSFVYDGNLISSNGGYDTIILKYDNFFGFINPSSYKYLDLNDTYVSNDLEYNSYLNHLYVRSSNNFIVLDSNLNIISQQVIPLGDLSHGLMDYNERLNNLVILENQGIHMISGFNYNTVSSIYKDFSSIGYLNFIQLEQLFDGSLITTGLIDIPNIVGNLGVAVHITKLDPISGELLDRNSDDIKYKDEELQIESKVYPNPFKNQLQINQTLENPITELIIADVFGKTILKKKITPKSNLIVLETSTIPKGIYLMKFHFENGATETKRIIKE